MGALEILRTIRAKSAWAQRVESLAANRALHKAYSRSKKD